MLGIYTLDYLLTSTFKRKKKLFSNKWMISFLHFLSVMVCVCVCVCVCSLLSIDGYNIDAGQRRVHYRFGTKTRFNQYTVKTDTLLILNENEHIINSDRRRVCYRFRMMTSILSIPCKDWYLIDFNT